VIESSGDPDHQTSKVELVEVPEVKPDTDQIVDEEL